jgi:hypothetical protein
MTINITTPKVIQPSTLCEIIIHATNNCPLLLEIKSLFNSNDIEPSTYILMVNVTLLESSIKCIKSLYKNHPCALCNTYGHYFHNCPKIPQFHDSHSRIHCLDSSPKEKPKTIVYDLTLRE